MKLIKAGYRILAGLLVLCMFGNEPVVYAVESDVSDNEGKVIESDVSDNEGKVIESDVSDNEGEVLASDVSDNEDETEETIHCSISSSQISNITNQSATFTVEATVEGVQPGEECVYLYVEYFCEGDNSRNQRVAGLADSATEEFTLSYLFADTDYTIKATIYRDNERTTILAETEEMYFHTLPNETDYKADVTFSNITDNSVTMNIALSEEVLANYQEVGNYYVGVSISYSYIDSQEDDDVSEVLYLRKTDGYARSLELTNLYAGTEYTVKVIWPAMGNSGKEISEYTFTTLKSEIDYTFSVEGEALGGGIVHFAMVSGYSEGEEYTVTIYRSGSTGSRVFDTCILNSGNNYTYESTQCVLEQMDVEYSVWAEVTQSKDGGTVNVLATDKVIKKIEKTQVFEISVVEDSVTYVIAKVNVRWINTEVIAEDEIELSVWMEEYGYVYPITLVKGEKEQATVEFYDLNPGETYEVIVSAQIGSLWLYNFEKSAPFSTKDYAFEPFTEVKSPSKEDIARKWNELGINLDQVDTYEREVNHTDGGLLSQSTLQNALDLTNFIRYVAGLPSDLIYDEEWCSICNAGCELNRLNGQLSHYPEKPDEVSEEFYQRGYKATSSSNLGKGYYNLARSILGYMRDNGEKNISNGHRNHVLNPALSTLGFGKSGSYYSMYVFSRYTDARETNFNKGYYYWPAANMPMEIYGNNYADYSFSLYLSSEYDPMFADDITVHVASKKLGKEWTFTGNTGTYSDGCYMLIGNCMIVFDTGVYPTQGDEVTVTVTGTTINGEPAPITYTMNFFSIADMDVEDIPVESVTVVSNTTEVMEGASIQFTANVLPENATNKEVSWSVESADGDGQATITEDGVLTGTLEGTVKVTATSKSDSSISDSVLVTVTEQKIPLKRIHFSKEKLRIEKGNSYYLPAILTPANTTEDEIIYSSTQPEKVTVVDGVIRALEVTETPVVIQATVGSLYAECLVEVYENAEELPDKNYDTRITGIVMSGESDIYVGTTNLIKYYPVTNGQELLASEYEMTITCDEKYLTLTPTIAEDNGCWYELTGMKAGKQKISITVKSKVEGNENPESVTKNFTYIVAEKASEEAEETSAAPVLVNSSISVNQNMVDGTALDIRLIEGNTNIKKVYLTSKKNDGTERLFAITPKSGTYYIQTKEIGANKKYNLIVHIETDQGVWEYPLKVTTKKSFPTVTIKQTVKPNTTLLYENAVFKVTGKEAIESVTFTTTSSDFVQVGAEGSGKDYLLTVGQREHGKKLDKKGTVEISFAGYRSVYSKKITVSTTSKKVKTNTLTSNAKKVTVNSENGEEIAATLQMGLLNSDEKYPAKIIINSTNNKTAKMLRDKSLYFTYNKNTGILKVFAKEGVTQGNYKYMLTGCILENGAYVETEGNVTLTVAVAAKEPTLTLKASGSIDLIAREQSCVTYTPSIKNIAGCVKAAELEGEDADKFYVRVEENGKIKVYARAYAALFPKATYTLSIKATLDNGYTCKPVQVKIKPKQSAFKASAKQSTITLCKSEVKAQPIEMVVKKPLSARIAHVKVISIPQGMTYDSENQTLQITDNKKVKAGKTYKVAFEVTPVGAYKSIKPAKVTIKVKVK